ncbi:hypothetical protein CI109_107375 [Kwoniella shandongensis]|uniref:Uncharacterized protein n=1 Tax=Kwoniella shandongensis TaxID=1734106 RepID=A0A5M6BX86_9TREE|nr:uncharacterized protein CI109_004697 [Kwoniella shandongensis]KAA5526921.1 hypothetical protein CI109_004697 [Kwoniella shandongensis]
MRSTSSTTHTHPDFTIPLLPDADDLPLPRSARSHHHQIDGEEYEWPEAGPSTPSATQDEGRIGPFGAKAVAAMTGALATSLLMTPFDVLKTRLQTVPPHPRSDIPPLGTTVAKGSSSDCCQTTLLTAQSTSKSSTNPLSCASTTAQISQPPSRLPPQALSFSALRPAVAPVSAPNGCLNPSKWAGIWGEPLSFDQALARGLGGGASHGGGGGAAVLTLPAGAQQTQLHVPEQIRKLSSGFWTEVAAVRRETGVKGLWKGVGTAITMGIPSSAIYMLGYEHLLTIISPIFTGSNDPARNASSLNRLTTSSSAVSTSPSITASLTPAPLIAGSMARTLSASIISPIEMFRTRLQALPSVERGTPTYASTVRDMSNLVKGEGLTILWRGLGPTLWRDVPFSGIYWANFELLKSLFTSPSSPLPPLTPITTSFLSGFISGTFAAIVTQPFDVLKTRRQVFNPSPGCTTPRAATIPLALHVIKTEGGAALFAGLSARCGKVAPACGLMIACYEGVGRWLGGRNE